jgi:hypothetical protein
MLNQQHNIVFDSLACKDTNPSAIMMKEGEKGKRQEASSEALGISNGLDAKFCHSLPDYYSLRSQYSTFHSLPNP